MKCHHADVFLAAIFLAAILNAQPMGFYGPAQLVRDAREHGVEVRPLISIARNGAVSKVSWSANYAL
jgi:DNA polymerase III alpha subunit